MAGFALNFGLGAVRQANENFRFERQAEHEKDLKFMDQMQKIIMPAYASQKVSAGKSKKTGADAARLVGLGTPILDKIPGGQLGQALVDQGLVDQDDLFEMLKNIPPEQQQALTAAPFKWRPGTPAVAGLGQIAQQLGADPRRVDKYFKENGLDPKNFQGSAAVQSQLSGGPEGFDPTSIIPLDSESPQGKLAFHYMKNPKMFANNEDFNLAKQANARGDFNTVIELSMKSETIQGIITPIIAQVLESGFASLSTEQKQVILLHNRTEAFDLMFAMQMIGNDDLMSQAFEDLGIDPEVDTEGGQTNFDKIMDNIGIISEWARRKKNELLGGN